MNLIKRLTTSVTATLDSTVGKIENHDAIVEATIKQTRQAVAKTKARINTLRQQENTYKRQLQEAQEQQELWTERARRLANSDQEKALQCVSRRNQAEREIKRLTQAIEQQGDLINKVGLNLQKLQSQLDETSYKHNLMRSRQAVADVNRAIARSNDDHALNETFERWESAVFEHELAVTDSFVPDALEHELSQQEDQQALLAQLAELADEPPAKPSGE
ncbi:MAG: hypothetical protein AAF431_06730 [Pseudomonadota bacterium]